MLTTRTTRRLVAVGGAVALLLAVGCGNDADQADDSTEGVDLDDGDQSSQESSEGFQATPGYLSKAVEESSGQAFRYEVSVEMSMGGEAIDFGGPIATGELDGERQYMHMDMGTMFEGIAGSLGESTEDLPFDMSGDDMVMEYVIDTDAMYMRAPFFATMFGSMPPGTDVGEAAGLVEAFGQLGDDWGRVDIAALGSTLPGEAAGSLGGGQTYDPTVFLDMIRASDDVEELGTDTIDGTEVTGLAADVSMADMLEAQGMSPDDLGPGSEDLPEASFPIEVWVDGEDLIRRIDFSFDSEALTDVAEESGEDVGSLDTAGFGMAMTMDFSDYGDESIEVEIPAGDEVVDITDSFVAGYESMTDVGIDADDLSLD